MQNRRIVYTCAVYVSMLSYIYVRCGLSRFSEHKPVGSVSFPPWGFSIMIPNSPKNEYDPASVKQLLAVAETYLFHADRLIYSYGSKTFLSGYAIYDEDHDGRGNIDCSTFLLLVLAGIPYEASPYTTGTVDGLKPASASWVQSELMDFTTLPKTYVDIAERIGRPYLACPKGLDLEKAAALGISAETLGEEIRKSGAARRSSTIARHYTELGDCYSDPAFLQPGDIVFYRSAKFFSDRGDEEAQIVHSLYAFSYEAPHEEQMNSSGLSR